MLRILYIPICLLLVSGCQSDSIPLSSQLAAESATESSAEPDTGIASGAIVVTANSHATQAGVRILEAGGSALDAAIAIQSVLSLVEPQSSGLGGGGFLVHFDAATKIIDVYEGRERAPAGGTAEMFLGEDGTAMPFLEAKNSGLSIGVPGMVSMLALAHKDHGSLEWANLFDSAIELAETGFEVSPRLAGFLERFAQYIPSSLEEGPIGAYQYFYHAEGAVKETLVNPEYAATLNVIAADARAFYTGAIAEDIVEAAMASPRAGSLALSDLSAYEAIKVEPLCLEYKENLVCGPPPPSSWLTVAMTLGILENVPRSLDEESRLQDWTMVGEALRLAYADRDQYVADTEFVQVPVSGLLSKEYLQERAALVDAEIASTEISYGDPWAYEGLEAVAYGHDTTLDMAGTTHFAVVDAQGNAVSLTASVESIFGSTRMAGGMFLNNQLTDFARTPTDESGIYVANIVEPFKKPRSSMSPTIVLDEDGEFLLSSGSPGGTSIISYTLKTLVGILDWGLSPQEAVNLPNMVARGDTVRIESERASPELIQALNDYGFNVQESAGENSGLSTVLRKSDGTLEGGVDPRREGTIGIPNIE